MACSSPTTVAVDEDEEDVASFSSTASDIAGSEREEFGVSSPDADLGGGDEEDVALFSSAASDVAGEELGVSSPEADSEGEE